MLGTQKIVYFKPENTTEVLNGELCYLIRVEFLIQYAVFSRFSSIRFRHVLD